MVQDPKSEQETETPAVDIDNEIKESMAAGKKHFLCSDYPEAVACFQEACKLLADKYGQMAEECGDAYYYYGSSLLELARLENGVLGNALKGVPEEEEESDKEDEQFEKPNLPEGEREQLREDVEAAMATEDEDEEGEEGDEKKEEGEKSEKSEDQKKEEKVPEEPKQDKPEQEKTEKSEKPSTSSESAELSSSKGEQTKEGEEEEEDPEDISNMQLAWEMLELAKCIYKKREKNKDNLLMVAQCHLKLGELGLEVENYPQAIGDFLECLVIQKEHLAETDRKLAETHYNLGLAYSFEKRYDNALEHYRNALNVLEARVDLLEELIENKEGESEKEDATMAECKEVGEIKDLIPDINSKIEDVLAVKKQDERRLAGSPFRQAAGETTTGFGASSSSSSGATCSTIPVRKVAPSSTAKDSTSDITHLVRRKRASPDEEGSAPDAEVDSKKAKQEENGSNGHAAHKNGNSDHTSPEKADGKEVDAAAALKKKLAAAGDAPVAMET